MVQYSMKWKLVIIWLVGSIVVQAGEREKVFITSSLDGTNQPSYVIFPDEVPNQGKVPLLVSLHSWSSDVEQRNLPLEEEANRLGWIYLFPHFRGPNIHRDACGSEKAQQDILDAVDWASKEYPVDRKRIYLTGVSGGGHMTMLMVGRYPDRWAAASAWVGISDLAMWYQKHGQGKYGAMMRQVFGDGPEASNEIYQQYRKRSPITWLHRSLKVPLDIAAGVHDGHQGSVPVRHSLDAFNIIARASGNEEISEKEIHQISRISGRLEKPRSSDCVKDSSFGREIYLRRKAGRSRVTIFEGGHEGIASAAVTWLQRYKKSPEE